MHGGFHLRSNTLRLYAKRKYGGLKNSKLCSCMKLLNFTLLQRQRNIEISPYRHPPLIDCLQLKHPCSSNISSHPWLCWNHNKTTLGTSAASCNASYTPQEAVEEEKSKWRKTRRGKIDTCIQQTLFLNRTLPVTVLHALIIWFIKKILFTFYNFTNVFQREVCKLAECAHRSMQKEIISDWMTSKHFSAFLHTWISSDGLCLSRTRTSSFCFLDEHVNTPKRIFVKNLKIIGQQN